MTISGSLSMDKSGIKVITDIFTALFSRTLNTSKKES